MPTRKYRLGGVWLSILPDDLSLRIPRGQSVWDALHDTDVHLESDCGGLGTCGKCRVKVLSEIPPPTDQDLEFLDPEELARGVRLACRTRVGSDMTVSTAEANSHEQFLRILTTSHHLKHRYVATSELAPLVTKRRIVLSRDIQQDGLSDIGAIRMGLGVEYGDLTAPLNCLRALPQKLQKTRISGTAVLHEHSLLDWQNDDRPGSGHGLVFDLGTSTLVGKLFSLADGSELAVASCLNGQSRHGADVISRLKYIREHPRGLSHLRRLMLDDLNQLTVGLLAKAKVQQDEVFVAVVAGNTTMQHILVGVSPSGIAEAPFSPVVSDGLVVSAKEVGLRLHPSAVLYVLPVKSGYIGGDLLSFVLASGVAEQDEEIVLGLDLGTNGEIFLGNRKRLLTCSAAAGPALEGARISHGMIARAGAIEGVSLDKGLLKYRVIGNVKPRGLCGSGLVDLVAALLRSGVIDQEGLIRDPQPGWTADTGARISKRSGANDYLVASPDESYDGSHVYLTQKDVRELQLAKGAIAAGVDTLMGEVGIGIQDIGHVYLAGALGNYIDPASAVRIGLLPPVNLDTVKSLGNAASTGASLVLLVKRYWEAAAGLTRSIQHIELSNHADFARYFVEHLGFPGESPGSESVAVRSEAG